MYVKRGDLWTEALNATERKKLLVKVQEELASALAGFQPDDEASEFFLIAAAKRWYGVRAEHEADRVAKIVEKKLRTEFAFAEED